MTKKPSARKAASDRDKLRGESQHPRREGGNMHASELHLEVLATVTDRCHRGASMCSSTATTSPAYCSLRAWMRSGAWRSRYGLNAALHIAPCGRTLKP